MTVYGFKVKKIDERLRPWGNTYYCDTVNRAQAEDNAEIMATAEATIHSAFVTITGAHIWEVNNAGLNFSNLSLDLTGALSTTNALPPWFTAEVNMPSDGSYPGWHRYRSRVAKAFYEDGIWSAGYLDILLAFCEVWDELIAPITTRAGVAFTGMNPNARPMPLQLGKKWYNRTSS